MNTRDQATQADNRIGLPVFGISLIALPPGHIRDRLSEIQDLIEASSPEEGLYRCPAATLHLSVFHFVWARSPHAARGPAEWDKCKARVLESIAAVTSSAPPFAPGRGAVHAGDAAIYLKFDASPALERLRDSLGGIATPLLSCASRPAIQHISLFRYRRSVAMRAVDAACAGLAPFSGDWEVGALQLVQENVYPAIDLRLIGEFFLGPNPNPRGREA
ncbi:hypothetical protein [Polaromonas sp. YR568]|uniref:hypothetical protein n=1 Tax=Polaromonas sp. YR568 TaxID=1855301 RepID=UPI00398C0C44